MVAGGDPSGTFELVVTLPTFKFLQSELAVHVRLVDRRLCCLGILNNTDVKKRNDPCFQVCLKPLTGQGKCVNISHISHKHKISALQWLIIYPTTNATSATAAGAVTFPTALSTPALPHKSLPPDFMKLGGGDCLTALKLSTGVWWRLLDGYLGTAALSVDTAPGSLLEFIGAPSTTPHETDVDEEELKTLFNEGGSITLIEMPDIQHQSSSGSQEVLNNVNVEQDSDDASIRSAHSSISGSAVGSTRYPDSWVAPSCTSHQTVTPNNDLASIFSWLSALETAKMRQTYTIDWLHLKVKEASGRVKLLERRLEDRDKLNTGIVKEEMEKARKSYGTSVTAAADLERLKAGASAVKARLNLVEEDLQALTGLLQDILLECKRVAALFDSGTIKLGGHVFCLEQDVLSLLETLPFEHKHQVFPDVNAILFLYEGGFEDFSHIMTFKKVTQGAEFPNIFVAKMSASHPIAFPPVIAKKGSSSDSSSMVWTSSWKSYATFTGGRKAGACTRKIIHCKIPVSLLLVHNAVALAMLKCQTNSSPSCLKMPWCFGTL